jgi:hypothetical protein
MKSEQTGTGKRNPEKMEHPAIKDFRRAVTFERWGISWPWVVHRSAMEIEEAEDVINSHCSRGHGMHWCRPEAGWCLADLGILLHTQNRSIRMLPLPELLDEKRTLFLPIMQISGG